MSGLSNRALLVSLTISQWSARKLDRRETAALALKHGTTEGVARVNKSLLPMAASLDRIHKLTGSIRTEFYSRTLPWGGEGTYILKAEGYMAFSSKLGEMKQQWLDAVADFLADYPSLREDARVILNGLYRDEDYPDADVLRRKFSMDISFYPVPEPGDCARVSLLSDMAEGMARDLADKLAESQKVAMKSAWQRIYDVVAKAHERLSEPDNIFRDSLVQNAIDLCQILPSLNIADDPNLETMRRELETSLCRHTPETLRMAPDIREDVAAKMKDIMDKMGAFYAP